MILPAGHTVKYLQDFRDGKIKQGLGIQMPAVDDYMRFKYNQFNLVLGHDNVGKTHLFLWYFLCLSSHHDLTWTLWAGENQSGQIMRNLIQMYSGKFFNDLTHKEIIRYEAMLSQWFTFVDNKKLYTPDELLEIFDKSETDGYLIDPYTGLDRQFSHEGNYKFLNHTRKFVNEAKRTLYLISHPNTESGRASRIFPKDTDFAGHLMPPLKDHVEGGKPFINRTDDVFVVHRLVKHDGHMKYTSWLDVAKVKNTDTGGKQTPLNAPIYLEFNSGLGYKHGFTDGIKRETTKGLQPNENFDTLDFSKPHELDEDCPF